MAPDGVIIDGRSCQLGSLAVPFHQRTGQGKGEGTRNASGFFGGGSPPAFFSIRGLFITCTDATGLFPSPTVSAASHGRCEERYACNNVDVE